MKNVSNFMNRLLCIFILLFILEGCHRTKSITKTVITPIQKPEAVLPVLDANAQIILEQLKSNELSFKEIVAKLKTKVSSPSLNQSFTTNIRWKKGEKIWLSMSIIGIEGARVLITNDSIKIMDKINNRYILKPLSYIKQKTLVDLTFSDIENLLLGQLIFTDTTKAKYANNETNITINSDGLRFLTNIFFDKSTKKPTTLLVTDKKYRQSIEATFTNYQVQLGKSFSMDRELRMKNETESFEMIGKFQSIEIKQNLEYPFSINPNYTIEK